MKNYNLSKRLLTFYLQLTMVVVVGASSPSLAQPFATTSDSSESAQTQGEVRKEINTAEAFPALEFPTTANALVSLKKGEDKLTLYSFSGLTNTNEQLELSSQALALDITLPAKSNELTASAWQTKAAVPSLQKHKGKFASNATVIGSNIYVLGGYSLNQVRAPKLDPNKQNYSDFFVYNSETNNYQQLSDLPVAVDDTLMLNYQDRYLYVVSGWHKDGAVNLVQVFDTYKNEWFQASPLPDVGVFGHAGGIIDNQILFCDGSGQQAQLAEPATLAIKQACWLGEINVIDPTKVTWYQWVHPSDKGRFRMAAYSDVNRSQIVFLGGATEQYDINGKSVSGEMVSPSNEIWIYNAVQRSWKISETPHPIMDLKGLVLLNDKLITVGGRDKNGITNKVYVHPY